VTIPGNPFSILGISGGGALAIDSVVVTPPAAPTITDVTVTPAIAALTGAATQQFSATVLGTNTPSQAVNWSCTAGATSSSGLFTAPAATLVPQLVSVTATSAVDPTHSGRALVTVVALPPPPINTDFIIQLAADIATVQQNSTSGGPIKLATHFTSEPAPITRTVYLS
jgi:hypothetical protein